MAFHHSPKIVSDGLVSTLDPANIKFYPRSGTTTTDLIDSNITGTMNGCTFQTSNVGIFDFDGTNDYLEISANAKTDFGTGDFSIGCWYKCEDVEGSNGGRYDRLWFLGQNISSTSLSCNVRGSGTTGYFEIRITDIVKLTTSTNIVEDTWQYLVIQRVSGQLQSYFNGVYDTQASNTQNLSGIESYAMRVGAEGGTIVGSYWNGQVSQIHIYNRSLSTTEVLQNYNALKGRFE
tara:strand:- start:146 stop:847 length:702 start_codon:yes stop_codon:yes gene_type:complete